MRPNIILIITDQQRTDSLGCYGSTFARTPAIDNMARNGVLFERAYCTNPVCTPSRASIFSGQYVSRHGAWNVGMNIPEDITFVSGILKDNGYKTHYIGKAHFQAYCDTGENSIEQVFTDDPRYPGFKGPYYGFETVELANGHGNYGTHGHYGVWLKEKLKGLGSFIPEMRSLSSASFGGEAFEWDLPVDLRNSAWTAERTTEYLKDAALSNEPFFLSVGFQDPHHPHCLPKGYEFRLKPEDIPLPDYIEGELDDKPPIHRHAHEGTLPGSPFKGDFDIAGQGSGFDYRNIPDDDARLGKAYYYGLCELIDDAVGGILKTLEDTGLERNTLVLFTTDHGELLGDHGIWMKGPFHYEQIVKIPFIVQFPGYEFADRKISSLVSQIDIAPFILDFCGIAAGQAFDGGSVLPVIKGDADDLHGHVIVECIDDPEKLRLKTIITKKYKLTCFLGQEFGELYDLENDPNERVNLWDDPDIQKMKYGLLNEIIVGSERLEKRFKRSCYA